MAELGKLTPSKTGDLTYLSGYLQTMQGRTAMTIEGDPALCDDRRPSHRVYALAPDRSRVDIGAAWLKTTKHGPKAGEKFLSIQIDHPDRPQPLNTAAFLDPASGDWIMVWTRKRGTQATAA